MERFCKRYLFPVLIFFSARILSGAPLGSPGTPCIDLGVTSGPCTAPPSISTAAVGALAFTFDIFDGNNALGIFVVPGDVVVFETPNGSPSNPAGWSDLVRFQNFPGATQSTAVQFSDLENGLPPFNLSPNFQTVVEIQTATGSESDITTYTAGTATYRIHSDAANPELQPEPSGDIPEPSTLVLLGGGLAALSIFGRRRFRLQ